MQVSFWGISVEWCDTNKMNNSISHSFVYIFTHLIGEMHHHTSR